MIENKMINNNTKEAIKSKKTPGPKKSKTMLESDHTNEVKQLVYGEFFNLQTMQVHFETNTFIEEETKKLKESAALDTSLRLNDFIDEQGYSPNVFRGWCVKYPLLELARDFALRRIGARRENGAMFRKFAESTVHRTLGHYDEIWREETALLHQMKDDKNNGPGNITVVMEGFSRLPGPDAPCVLKDLELQGQISSRTPENVAGKIHQSTGKNIGSHY